MPNIINADNGLVSGSVGLKYACDNTGVLALQTSGNTAVTIDTSQNVGIGVTPTLPVYNLWRVLQIGNSNSSGILYARTDSDKSMGLMINGYYSGSAWLYRNTGAAASVEMADNIIYFQNAPSGNAGSSLTWTERMRIDANGNVGIGTTTPTDTAGFSRALDLNGASGAALYTRTNGSATSWTAFGNFGVDGYVNNRGAGSLLFFNNNAERMRITSGGFIGINTSSPTTHLTIDTKQANYTDGIDLVNSTNWGYGTSINFRVPPSNNASLATVSRIQQFYEAANKYGLFFATYNSSLAERGRFTAGGYFKATGDGTYYSATGNYHEFRGGDNGNNLVIYTHTGASSPYGPYMQFSAAAPNNASNYFYYFADTASARCIIYSNGNIVNLNNSYGPISDIKYKENIVDATPKLDKVMQLKVRNFNLKQNPDLKQIGFVAQEFEEIFPSMVEDSAEMGKDGKPTGETGKTLKMTVLIPILVKAMQEQQAMIEELKAEVALLKSKE